MSTQQSLEELVAQFRSQVPSLKPFLRHEFDVIQFDPQAHLNDQWRVAPAVYYFLLGDEVEYVGCGVNNGVGCRVYKGLSKIGLEAGYPASPTSGWANLKDNPEAKVVILQFDQSDWFWPWSLEALLIGALQPTLNRVGKKTKLHARFLGL